MAVLVRPKRWTRKPSPGATINFGHPLANGLVGVWLLNEGGGRPRELLTGTTGTKNGSPTWTQGPAGPAIATGTSNYYSFADSSRYTASSKGLSIVTSAWLNTSTDDSPICSKDQSGQREFQLDYRSAAQSLRFIVLDNTAGGNIGRGVPFTVLNAWRHVVATYDGGTAATNVKLYLDGIQKDDTSVGTGTFTQVRDTTSPFNIGEFFGGSGYWPGRIGHIYMYNRALTAREAQQLYIDPFAFFVPQTPVRRLWVPSAAAPTNTARFFSVF